MPPNRPGILIYSIYRSTSLSTTTVGESPHNKSTKSFLFYCDFDDIIRLVRSRPTLHRSIRGYHSRILFASRCWFDDRCGLLIVTWACSFFNLCHLHLLFYGASYCGIHQVEKFRAYSFTHCVESFFVNKTFWRNAHRFFRELEVRLIRHALRWKAQSGKLNTECTPVRKIQSAALYWCVAVFIILIALWLQKHAINT